jgi:hypothetical protein
MTEERRYQFDPERLRQIDIRIVEEFAKRALKGSQFCMDAMERLEPKARALGRMDLIEDYRAALRKQMH